SGKTKTWLHLPAHKALAVYDAAGSGDWCTAGFLARIANGASPISQLEDPQIISDCLQFGQALAALNCAYYGARGLMYAVSCTDAVEAAEQILTQGEPRLPRDFSVPSIELRAGQSCTICSSELHSTRI